MTRKRIQDTDKQMAEYLKSSGEVFCDITKDVPGAVTQGGAATTNETHRLLHGNNVKYSASLDTLTNNNKDTLDNHHVDSQALIVYQVIEAIKSTTSANHRSSDINIENKKIAKRIIRIVSIHQEEQLQELNDHLIQRNHPEMIILVTFTKLVSGSKARESYDQELSLFTQIYNPSVSFIKDTITKHIDNVVSGEYTKKELSGSRNVADTRPPPPLRNKLVVSKCSTKVSEEKWKDTVGLFACRGCINHLKGYVFKFGKRKKILLELHQVAQVRYRECDLHPHP